MSKKTLFILLLLPFALAISFFAFSSYLVTKVKGDISSIEWEYKNNEVFALDSKETELKAKAVLADHQEDVDATLYWSIKNQKTEDLEQHAKIEVREEKSYLVFLSIGNVVVTCTNSSGNISKSFNAKIYEDGVILMNTKRERSHESIEQYDYYGMYDLDGQTKTKAVFYLDVLLEPIDVKEYITIETSDNIEYNDKTGRVLINNPGKSYIRYKSSNEEYVNSDEYNFDVVEDGINVYSYSDLLYCTNKSTNGEIICLQVNLEAYNNTYNSDNTKKNDVTELFGTYNNKTKKYNFSKEVYKFNSTYNTEYIDQYNAKSSDKISKELIAGIHIQKDFYGNGYSINQHNLTYPTGQISSDNYIVSLSSTDLFRGPLPFILIGSSGMPIVKAYGQDNVGFYVDGDGITLRDVNFKNCIYSNVLENNDYTGTVVEVNGDNVSILNSHLSSGKTVLRSFSNKNTLIKNCLLEKGREFIAKVGSNDYKKIDSNQKIEFTFKGVDYSYTYDEFFNSEDINEWNLNRISGALLKTSYVVVNEQDKNLTDNERFVLAEILDRALSNLKDLYEDESLVFKNDITFDDCMFYQSGLFSIGIDTLFNGPYMYDGSPVKSVLNLLPEDSGVVIPNNISGVSYPSKVYLKGDTEFYDYKTIDQVNLSCLINTDNLNETIKVLMEQMAGEDAKPMTIDDFFPIKSIMKVKTKEYNCVVKDGENEYINTPFAMYGGGINLSELDISELNNSDKFLTLPEEDDIHISLDIYKEVLNNTAESSGDSAYIKGAKILQKCVSMAIGFEPFDLITYGNGYLYGKIINFETLRNRVHQ